jgi:hypothetical protein
MTFCFYRQRDLLAVDGSIVVVVVCPTTLRIRLVGTVFKLGWSNFRNLIRVARCVGRKKSWPCMLLGNIMLRDLFTQKCSQKLLVSDFRYPRAELKLAEKSFLICQW